MAGKALLAFHVTFAIIDTARLLSISEDINKLIHSYNVALLLSVHKLRRRPKTCLCAVRLLLTPLHFHIPAHRLTACL